MMHHPEDTNGPYDISIVVATYNRAKSLSRFLASLDSLENLESVKLEVLIVDNDSTDQTRNLLVEEQQKPRMFLLQTLHETQRGRAAAVNCGLRRCRAQIICVMDDDVVLDRNWLKGLLYSYRTTDFDALQGKVLPGVDPSGKPPDIKRLYQYNITIIDRGGKIKETNGLVGVCSFRRQVLEKVGLLDSRLGVGASGFGEDSEFSRRVRAAGFRFGYTPTPLSTTSSIRAATAGNTIVGYAIEWA